MSSEQLSMARGNLLALSDRWNSGLVLGRGAKYGLLQQVVWFPDTDTHGFPLKMIVETEPVARVITHVLSQQGEVVDSMITMAQTSIGRIAIDMATTSYAGEALMSEFPQTISTSLREKASLISRIDRRSVDEHRFAVGLTVQHREAGLTDDARKNRGLIELLARQPGVPFGDLEAYTARPKVYTFTNSEFNLDLPGGLGRAIVEGPASHPRPLTLPLEMSGPDTAGLYEELLGPNIIGVVKEVSPRVAALFYPFATKKT